MSTKDIQAALEALELLCKQMFAYMNDAPLAPKEIQKLINTVRRGLTTPAPTGKAVEVTVEGYNQGFYDGWMGCGVYHIDLDFETTQQKSEVERRLTAPNTSYKYRIITKEKETP